MAQFEVTSPDGRQFVVTAPDGASQDDVLAYARQQFTPAAPQTPQGRPPATTAQNMVAGAIRGAGSIGATLLSPIDWLAKKTGAGDAINNATGIDFFPADRRAGMDDFMRSQVGADTDSLAYKVGKTGTEVAGTLGVGGLLGNAARALGAAPEVVSALASGGMNTGRALPAAEDIGLRAVAGAATGGASATLVDPSEARVGAAVGAAIPTAIRGAGDAGRWLWNAAIRPDAARAALADAAINKYGIPLAASDVTSNTMLRAARSIGDDLPLVGRIGAAHNEAVQSAYNRAMGRTFGADSDKLIPEVVKAAQDRLGAAFDQLWNNNKLVVDPQLFTKLQDVAEASEKLPANETAAVKAWLNDIYSKMGTDPATGSVFIGGETANNIQSALRRQVESGAGSLKNELNDLRQSLLGAFNRNVSPQDAALLAQTQRQYKAWKTLQPIIQKAEAGVAGREVGNVTPGLVPGRVADMYGDYISNSPFADLSQIGSQFIADRTLRTGGSSRAMAQGAMLGWLSHLGGIGGVAVGGPLLYGAEKVLTSPWIGAAMAGAQQPIVGLLGAPGSFAARATSPALAGLLGD